MTLEEETLFREKIKETILPLAMNMTEEQIRNIILSVEKANSELPVGFGAMLFEQIMIHKYNQLKKL
ncbi:MULTISPECIES: hypothetical protein [Arcobacter]|mgnify:CR=1 FL=1|jgi:hypothetical protein|uniref:Uncharacterized protein n=1 Tax=Arcobacter ellisii TaxID=913109 RepID=A0A347U882_9BACT|nr:hypothetical protein [Arcobacter ellisii]AXX95060.1 hypothetical protein AELL_1397 [Arcobacter ellisii]RXI30381.1 hypothetical protein CP962_08520 [Arcobacter ellisii]